MDQATKTFKAGEPIYFEGDDPNFIYIIKRGVIRLYRFREKRLLTLATLVEKDIFGSEDVFRKSPYSNTAVALEDTALVPIKGYDILKQMSFLPGWTSKIMETLAIRLDEAESILDKHKIYESSLNEVYQLKPQIESSIKEKLTEKFES
jgi:CRP/FNR family cyclic AMP-dependent transcriptional regulator